jgi:hypothetical protein
MAARPCRRLRRDLRDHRDHHRHDRTAAGDTPEAHDEINPHDLPPDHPGRQAAEEEASEEPRDDGARTTRGDDELAQAPPEREERLERPPAAGLGPGAGGAREQRSG